MSDVKFKQIFAEGDVLYGLAEDGTVWICKIRTRTENGVGLKLGELIDAWEKISSPKEKQPEETMPDLKVI